MPFIIVVGLGMLIICMPLVSPIASIGISILVWPIVYYITHLYAAGFDPTQSLPWYIADPDRATTTFLIFAGVIGLLRGPLGSVAMLTVWAPLFLMPTWLLNLGVAIEYPTGWVGYVLDNYDSPCGVGETSSRYNCTYSPIKNAALPSFTADYDDRILEVIPAGGITPDGIREVSTNENCNTTVTIDQNGAKTVTETCVSFH